MPETYARISAAPAASAATEFTVRMRDGIGLSTEVYTAEGDAPGPTILIRLPYDKDGEYTFIPLIAAHMRSRGYHVVAQDVRGKFRSEGVPIAWTNEVEDGYDTIDWIARQVWSNGSVAMWGDSYYGFTGWAAVASGHPALKAIAPRVTGTRLGGRPITVPGSTYGEVEDAHSLAYTVTMFYTNDSFYWEPDAQARPLIAQFERLQSEIGFRSASYDAAYPEYTSAERFGAQHPFDAAPVPVLHTIGIWDNCSPWSWSDHDVLSRRPEWEEYEYLLLEPIDHENYRFGSANGDRERTADEILAMLPEYLNPALDFFDVFVRGLGAPADVPRVRWTPAGTTERRESSSWPPPASQTVELALHQDGRLSSEVPSSLDQLSWVHDPASLIPTAVPDPFSFLRYSPDERRYAERSDVLTFVTDPGHAQMLLAGPVSVIALVQAEADGAHYFARLYDRAPNGALTRIAGGQVAMVDHAGTSDPTEVSIGLGHATYLLPAGHALQLHIQGSDHPQFLYATGTAESGWEEAHPRAFQQSIRTGGPSGARLRITTVDDD